MLKLVQTQYPTPQIYEACRPLNSSDLVAMVAAAVISVKARISMTSQELIAVEIPPTSIT